MELRDAVVAAGYPSPNWELNGKDDGPQNAKESGTRTDDDALAIYAKVQNRKPKAQGLGHSYPRGGANVAPRRSTSVPK